MKVIGTTDRVPLKHKGLGVGQHSLNLFKLGTAINLAQIFNPTNSFSKISFRDPDSTLFLIEIKAY